MSSILHHVCTMSAPALAVTGHMQTATTHTVFLSCHQLITLFIMQLGSSYRASFPPVPSHILTLSLTIDTMYCCATRSLPPRAIQQHEQPS